MPSGDRNASYLLSPSPVTARYAPLLGRPRTDSLWGGGGMMLKRDSERQRSNRRGGEGLWRGGAVEGQHKKANLPRQTLHAAGFLSARAKGHAYPMVPARRAVQAAAAQDLKWILCPSAHWDTPAVLLCTDPHR